MGPTFNEIRHMLNLAQVGAVWCGVVQCSVVVWCSDDSDDTYTHTHTYYPNFNHHNYHYRLWL